MPDINTMFPSKYLKAADLRGKSVTVTIDRVVQEQVVEEEPDKWIVYFSENRDRGMVLNKTNALMISSTYGDNSDLWIGKAVELYTEQVSFQGKIVPGLRVKPVAAQVQPNPAPPATAPERAPFAGPNDDLPF